MKTLETEKNPSENNHVNAQLKNLNSGEIVEFEIKPYGKEKKQFDRFFSFKLW